jgi:adenylate kinase family enzyme
VAARLGGPHIELDAIHWGPDWVPCPPEEFRRRVDEATQGEVWVVDGNYSPVQDLVWARATDLVWLDYSFARIFGRALRRTVRRVVRREELFGGCRESFRLAFLSRESILWWVIRTYRRRRRAYHARLRGGEFPDLRPHVFTHPGEADRFLEGLDAAASEDGPPAVAL